MAHTPFHVEILTPEGQVFDGPVEMLSTRTTTGSIGVLANHMPLLGMLEATELRLHINDNEIVRFAQGEGYLQVRKHSALVLVEEAIRPEDLDVAELREKLHTAETELAAAEDHTEAQRRALRDRNRWRAFLAVAGEQVD